MSDAFQNQSTDHNADPFNGWPYSSRIAKAELQFPRACLSFIEELQQLEANSKKAAE